MEIRDWRTAEGAGLARMIFGRLLSGRSLDDLSLDEHQGRLDLRGITLPSPEVLRARWRTRAKFRTSRADDPAYGRSPLPEWISPGRT